MSAISTSITLYIRCIHNLNARCSILAAYDLGASAKQLQAIYDCTKDSLDGINLADRKSKTIEKQRVEITSKNWHEILGQEKCAQYRL